MQAFRSVWFPQFAVLRASVHLNSSSLHSYVWLGQFYAYLSHLRIYSYSLPYLAPVAPVYNPSCTEGRDQEDCSLRPAGANILQDPSKNKKEFPSYTASNSHQTHMLPLPGSSLSWQEWPLWPWLHHHSQPWDPLTVSTLVLGCGSFAAFPSY
jgi:hypothetical protein